MALCNVNYGMDEITITAPGGKTCILPIVETLTSLTDDERTLYNSLDSGEREFSREDMLMLVSIRTKLATPSAVVSGAYNRTATLTASRTVAHQKTGAVLSNTARMQQMEAAVKQLTDDDLVMLIYDIPSVLSVECPNPSKLLWAYGFRLNLSCWVLPSRNLNAPAIVELLRLWQTHNIQTHVIKYAESERAAIKAIAVQKLEEEIRRQHTSLIGLIDSADAALKLALTNETLTPKEIDRADAYRDNRVRSALRNAADQLDSALKCAALFDESMQTSDLIDALKHVIESRRLSFNREMRNKDSKPA